MQDHLVFVADSRDHGHSSCTAEPCGYDLVASDDLALLDFLAIARVDHVGWSDGGIIGIGIGIKVIHPTQLDKLFAQAANVTSANVTSANVTSANVTSANVTSDGVTSANVTSDGVDPPWPPTRPSNAPSPGWATTIRTLSHPGPVQPVRPPDRRDVDDPARLVRRRSGELHPSHRHRSSDHHHDHDRDEVVSRAHTDHMTAVTTGATATIRHGASHIAMLQAPVDAVAAIRAFLQ